jgi:ParB family chromosome partitioning protein
MATRKARRKKAAASSRGLAASEVCDGKSAKELDALTTKIEEAGGALLGAYRDPLGGNCLALAALPLETVAPTPFQRDLSDATRSALRKRSTKSERFSIRSSRFPPIAPKEKSASGLPTAITASVL